MQLCLWSMAYACPYHNPTTTMRHGAIHAVCHLPGTVETGIHPWRTHFSSIASGHLRWSFAHCSRLRRWTAIRSRPWWGREASRWASLRRFLTVCAEILRFVQTTSFISGGHSCSQHANCMVPQNLSLWHCVVWQNLYCPQRKVHLCKDHAI